MPSFVSSFILLLFAFTGIAFAQTEVPILTPENFEGAFNVVLQPEEFEIEEAVAQIKAPELILEEVEDDGIRVLNWEDTITINTEVKSEQSQTKEKRGFLSRN